MHFDFVVIGGGSAGYAAARTARDAGLSVAVVEGGREVGGLCILRGCMPTKALIESSHRLHEIRRAREFGLAVTGARALPRAILKRKDALIADFARHRKEQLESGRFTFLRGHAAFLDAETLEVSPLRRGARKQRVTFGRALIATGSVVNDVALPGLREAGFLTSDTAIRLDRIPPRLAVLGGGVVALEFAQHFARLGTRVTLLQRSAHVLRGVDDDAASAVEAAFRDEGIRVVTGVTLDRVEIAGGAKRLHYRVDGKRRRVDADDILFALGRRPAVDGLNCAAAGVDLERGAVKVNAFLQTSHPRIYAAGDVTGLFEVVHIAIQQAEIAAKNAALPRPRHRWDARLACTVVFTDPNVAVVGATERQLQAAGRPYLAASYPFHDHGKSMIHGARHGFVKLIGAPRTGEILGATLVGLHAGELIHELIAVMHWRGTAADLAALPHYHPTLAEIITYPAEDLAEQVAKLRG
jgi:pyruvate/2-oxoglutarate dehydrogenase complex dihydrolipoamide dehydrogenase (E3) component